MSRPRLLVVVAHPDDETFGCGSILAHAEASGVETWVCCATRGEAGEPAPGCGVTPDRLAGVREAELRSAATYLGASGVEVLGFTDSGMSGEPQPGSLCGAPEADVVAAVVDVVERLRPTVVVTLDGSDGHRDHIRMRDATIAAVERATWPVERLYLTCLPRDLMVQWLDLLAAGMPESEHLDIDPSTIGTPVDDITTVLDNADHEVRRWEAIRLHRSQTSPYDAMPADLQSAFLRTDRLTRVRPPWAGGPVETSLFEPLSQSRAANASSSRGMSGPAG
jgi:LmbE family N-acetylglucosaminyl deacetylase